MAQQSALTPGKARIPGLPRLPARVFFRALFYTCVLFAVVLAAPFARADSAAMEAMTPPQPAWAELHPEQQAILAPLAGEWDRMGSVQRKKWLNIAAHYPQMPPRAQQRVQEQMQEWAHLAPEQREAARKKFQQFKDLPPQEKQAVRKKWEEYQKLQQGKRHPKTRSQGNAAPEALSAPLSTPGDAEAAPGPALLPEPAPASPSPPLPLPANP